jgi:cytochrome c-type biogenesis protein CcmH
MSDDDIKNFLVARYGVFVLMKPPVQEDTAFLWFGPAILVLVGAGVIGVTVLRARRRLATDPASDLDASA